MTIEDTTIEINLPLPIDVVSTLMLLIGSAYPDSVLTQQGRWDNRMGFKIPAGSRVKKISKTAAAKMKQDASEMDGFDVTEANPNGFAWAMPEDVANMCREVIEAAFKDNPDAANYLEWVVRGNETGKRYVMTFCRSKQQTPHDLRMAAEAKLAIAEARIKELEAAK